MVMLKGPPVAWVPVLSVTRIVNVNVPRVVGVPDSRPDGSSLRPGGNAPDASDHE